jgi:hypothetical protein
MVSPHRLLFQELEVRVHSTLVELKPPAPSSSMSQNQINMFSDSVVVEQTQYVLSREVISVKPKELSSQLPQHSNLNF